MKLLLICFISLVVFRDSLNLDLEKLREEQAHLTNDLSNVQMRWHTLREEKLKASSTLHKVKRIEVEVDQLAEEKAQVEFDEKVS